MAILLKPRRLRLVAEPARAEEAGLRSGNSAEASAASAAVARARQGSGKLVYVWQFC